MEKSHSRRSKAAALLVALVGLGCSPPPPRPIDLSVGERTYSSTDYGRVVNRWTRHARLQKSFDRVAPFDTALDVRATFESWDWRWAYVERYADYFKLGQAEKDRLRDAELKDADRMHDFHVAATASRYEWTDFVNKKNLVWRVVMFDDRERAVEPVELYPVKAPAVQEIAFFPYVGVLDQAFLTLVRFRFPTRFEDGSPTISPDTKHVTLRFTGPLGTVDLVWETVLAHPPR